jgi:hypothetical protein
MRSKRIGHSTELGKPEGTLGVLEKEGFAVQDNSSVRRPNRSARLL